MSNLVSILDHTMPHILTDSQSNMTQAQYLTNGNHVNGVSKSHLTNGVAKPQPQVTQSATKSDHVWTSMRCMDEPRPLKLIYVGGGISGICGAIEFIKQVPDLEMVIYEKNPELGGTWYENRYPGCACGKSFIALINTPSLFSARLTKVDFPRCSCPCISARKRVFAKMDILLRYSPRNSSILERCCRQV